jgi:hypothetical protein
MPCCPVACVGIQRLQPGEGAWTSARSACRYRWTPDYGGSSPNEVPAASVCIYVGQHQPGYVEGVRQRLVFRSGSPSASTNCGRRHFRSTNDPQTSRTGE